MAKYDSLLLAVKHYSHSTIKVPFTKQKMCKNKSYRIGDISLVFKSWSSQEYRKKVLPK